jgi:hypothetical protein
MLFLGLWAVEIKSIFVPAIRCKSSSRYVSLRMPPGFSLLSGSYWAVELLFSFAHTICLNNEFKIALQLQKTDVPFAQG